MKIIYIIPGFFEYKLDYEPLKSTLSKVGWSVKIVPITWKYKTPSDWFIQARAYLHNKDLIGATLLGFSAGGLTALQIASKRHDIERLVLCSFPYAIGGGLTSRVEKKVSFLGKLRIEELKNIDVYKELEKVRAKRVDFIYGSRESALLKKYAKRMQKIVPRCRLISIRDAFHDINSPAYGEGLAKIL